MGTPGGGVRGQDEAGDDLRDPARACLGGRSFTPGTLVLLASGEAAPISSLKPGDKVLAANTRTGKDQPETITAVEVNRDTDLYDLRVKTSHGTEIIHTTASHLFWDPYQHQWIASNKLPKGEHLKTPDGSLAVADGGTTPKVHDGWMWDLTVPGNNDHDFYVIPDRNGRNGDHVVQAGVAPVLVHNQGGPGCPAASDSGTAGGARSAGSRGRSSGGRVVQP